MVPANTLDSMVGAADFFFNNEGVTYVWNHMYTGPQPARKPPEGLQLADAPALK